MYFMTILSLVSRKLILLTSIFMLLLSSDLIGQEYGGSSDLRINQLVYGTLLTPETPKSTIAIVIPGSGPTDRNGNQQMMRNNSLKLLAESLAQEGIASFRYDKRVLTLLKKNALQEEKLDFNMFIDDAVAVIEYFKMQGRFKNIYVIGHDQGALIGMVASQQSEVQGFISLSGSGQSIDQTIINQISLQMPDLKEKAVNAFTTLKSEGKVKNYSPALASIFRPAVQPFMASWMQYDPKMEIGKLTIPTLIINGTKDIQVSNEEARLLKEGNNNATLVNVEGMNHVLRVIEGDDLENTKSYNLTGLPISTELITTITGFIKSN